MSDEVTKSGNVSASRERDDAITASPRPWSLFVHDEQGGGDGEVSICAEGEWIATMNQRRSSAKADAALICDAVNERDRLNEDIESWRRGYIKARTERNACLLERDRLRADLRSLADEFDGYAEADGIRAPAYASLFRSLAERLRGMVEARPAAKPLGRPATEEEVDGGKAQWCQVCVAKCPLAGRDALAVCDAFKEKGDAL